MRTESLRRSFVPILLAFAMVIALVFVVPPVSAGGVASDPGGTTITIAPGDVFLLRHELYFNDPAKGGYFTIAITWNCPSSDENFTVENVWVHWTTGPESSENVENVLSYDQPTTLGGENAWQVVVKIPAENKVWVDGDFNVDIWLRTSSEGVPHKLGLFENVLDYGLGIMVVETGLGVTLVSPVSIHVFRRGVDVLISPDHQSGLPCTTLNYTVTVTNTGTENDNFVLAWSDNASWDNITLDDNRFDNVPPDNSRTTTLRVHIPTCVEGCTEDNITVTATGTGVDNSASCIAHVAVVRGVEVSIEPDYDTGEPCSTLEYTVTVTNTGNVDDVFSLSWGDNAGWGDNISLEVSSLSVARCGGENSTKLFVHIPTCVEGCTEDNITVTATGTGVENSASCIAHVEIVRGVEVLIEPESQPGVIGENVVFTVTVKNTGNVWDNYNLTPTDDAGWALKLDNDYLEIPKSENRETKLTIFVPDNENLVCTTDNITVVATAVDNAEVTDNETVTVHAVHVVEPWTGTAVFSLENLYTVNVEKILDLNQGSKLVVKFYTYGDAFENENVIEIFSPPWHVEENENAPHPQGKPVEKARLDLTTDDTENVISTIATFTVRRSNLIARISAIKGRWPFALPAERSALISEISDIKGQWPFAPF